MSRNNNNNKEDALEGIGQADIGRYTNTDESGIDSTTTTTASWRELLEISNNKSRKIRGSNYVQLATVNPDTFTPRCRTVVFRGFQDVPAHHLLHRSSGSLSCILRMCTDGRSQKVDEIIHQPAAELVWWFAKTSEQYRIRGVLILVGGYHEDDDEEDDDDDKYLQQARKQLWGNLSDAARESFLDPAVPGQAIRSQQQQQQQPQHFIPTGGRDDAGKVVAPPDHFLLMLLVPSHVDYLRLSNNQYRQIDVLTTTGTWESTPVNP